MDISKLLIQYRIDNNLTQNGLAKLVGVGRITVIRWEQGKGINPLSWDRVKEILRVKRCPNCGKEL